jgi:hypothetical protein
MPPAPPRVSTMNVWPSASVYFLARSRAVRSDVPPGDAGTMMRTGLAGQACPEPVEVVCACADTATHENTVMMAAAIDFILSLRGRIYFKKSAPVIGIK